MLNLKKWLLIPSVVALPLVATTVTSCSIIQPDLDLADQLESLTSPEAKEVYSNTWSRKAFAHLYLLSLSPNENTETLLFQKQANKIFNYLTSLDPSFLADFGSLISGKMPTDDLIRGELFGAYNFYISWKSSTDLEYFINQSIIWNQKFDLNFKPQYGYSSNTAELTSLKVDFDNLYDEIQTGIQTELLNMMIAQFYFTSTTSNIIKRGTNYNEVVNGDINSIQYWHEDSFNVTSPSYFLEKYLVEKSPRIKWNYTSENPDKILDNTNKDITTTQEYNNLWSGEQGGTTTSPKTIFSKDLIIKTNDALFASDPLQFYGYNSAIELSPASGEGDLSTNIDMMMRFGRTYSGLFDAETNKLFSYDMLKDRELISSSNQPLLSVNLLPDTNTTRKNSTQITQDDLLIGGISLAPESKFKVLAIIPILGTSSRQTINVQMNYDGQYPYDVTISWDQTSNPADANIESELKDNYTWQEWDSSFGKRQKLGINPIIEGKVNVTYYIRLLPHFTWNDTGEKVTEINGEQKAKGKFSMSGTPWPDAESQETLAFSLYMNDVELLNTIKSVLVLNDISLGKTIIDGHSVPQVDDILTELGILVITNKPDYVDKIPPIPQA